MTKIKLNSLLVLGLIFFLCISCLSTAYAFQLEQLLGQAESGDVDAQMDLADRYFEGDGIDKNVEQAFYWYEKSATGPDSLSRHPFYVIDNSGKTEAQFQLGQMYAQAMGVEEDLALAERWFIQSALSDNTDNKYNLAEMYLHGNLLQQDVQHAFLWHLQAAIDGNRDSQYSVAAMFHNAQGVDQNDQQALKWYLLAAEQGDSDAKYELGYIFHKGIGTEVDSKKALHWYKQAFEEGNKEAKTQLDQLNKNTGDVEQAGFDNKSIDELKMLANQGDTKAQYHLGLIYEQGNDIEKDLIQAYQWLSLSANNGDLNALKYRAKVLVQITTKDLIKANQQVKSFQVISD